MRVKVVSKHLEKSMRLKKKITDVDRQSVGRGHDPTSVPTSRFPETYGVGVPLHHTDTLVFTPVTERLRGDIRFLRRVGPDHLKIKESYTLCSCINTQTIRITETPF